MSEEPLRLLIATPRSPFELGGVERHVLEVSTRLAARGVDVTVVCGDASGGPGGERTRDGVRVRALPAKPAGRDWYFVPALWREIGQLAPDVIHVQSYHTLVAPLAMARARSLRTPYVVTFHAGGHSSGLRNRVRPLQLRALRPLLAGADRLVALSRFEIESYGQQLRLPADHFVLIPNGVESPPAWLASQPGEEGVLATIGRLERYKGHDRVIAALPFVLSSRPDAQLLVVGSGPYEPELRAQAQSLDLSHRITFTSTPPGDAEAMAEVLARVSLVVLMSEYETQPLVGLEAAAARRRLLVADRGGLRELASDGLARAIAHDSTPAQLAQAIVEALDGPPPAAAPTVTSWDNTAERLLALYRSL